MEALSLHEAVPGHHLQLSLGQEMENVAEFRKHAGYSAFVEAGRCTRRASAKSWACTKIRTRNSGSSATKCGARCGSSWTPECIRWADARASDSVFKDNTGKTDQDITVEVDRYIVWPGQALAYKLGQLKIRELRTEAEKKLGAKFDVRKFTMPCLRRARCR